MRNASRQETHVFSASFCRDFLLRSSFVYERLSRELKKRNHRAGHKKKYSIRLNLVSGVFRYAAGRSATARYATNTSFRGFAPHRAKIVAAAEELFLWRAERLAGVCAFPPGPTHRRAGRRWQEATVCAGADFCGCAANRAS